MAIVEWQINLLFHHHPLTTELNVRNYSTAKLSTAVKMTVQFRT